MYIHITNTVFKRLIFKIIRYRTYVTFNQCGEEQVWLPGLYSVWSCEIQKIEKVRYF
jgi:hypothetical protein